MGAASPKPLSRESGDSGHLDRHPGQCLCFNEAALSRERRPPPPRHGEQSQRRASTKPLSRESGDRDKTMQQEAKGYVLQRSRSLARAETCFTLCGSSPAISCFNEAALSRERRPPLAKSSATSGCWASTKPLSRESGDRDLRKRGFTIEHKLQRSRSLARAETWSAAMYGDDGSGASTKPLSRESGDLLSS